MKKTLITTLAAAFMAVLLGNPAQALDHPLPCDGEECAISTAVIPFDPLGGSTGPTVPEPSITPALKNTGVNPLNLGLFDPQSDASQALVIPDFSKGPHVAPMAADASQALVIPDFSKGPHVAPMAADASQALVIPDFSKEPHVAPMAADESQTPNVLMPDINFDAWVGPAVVAGVVLLWPTKAGK